MAALRKKDIKDVYRLSPMQQGMLYHYLLKDGSKAYFEQMSLKMEGSPDVENISEAFNKLIERYDVLRTVFLFEKVETPLQVVMKERKSGIRYEDIHLMSDEEKEAYIINYKMHDQSMGFDLAADIPIRISVIKTGSNKYELVWSFHHIIMDGWSLGIIMKEFMDIYKSLKKGSGIKLSRVYPYSDYIKWLDRQDTKEAGLYWDTYLEGFTEKSLVPGKVAALEGSGYQLREDHLKIGKDTTRKLEDIAERNNATMGSLIQAVWGIMLQKYNNSGDVVFGAVVSGRPHEITGIENMVGLFINTLPVRVKAREDETFMDVFERVQKSAVAQSRFSYYPLYGINSKTEFKDNLIDHIIAFENYPLEESDPEGNTINSGNNDSPDFKVKKIESFEQTNYDFNIVIQPGKELDIKFSYNSLAYDKDAVAGIKGHFKKTVETVASNPEAVIGTIELATDKEKAEILHGFNMSKAPYPIHKTVLQLFEEQAEKAPGNVAAVCGDSKITYGGLNEKAGQLAYLLRERGVRNEDIVAIMAERSLEMIVGIMGILKAGGAYLPIDPEYPSGRIEYMLKDSGSKILLTQKNISGKAELDGTVLCMDDEELYKDIPEKLEIRNKSTPHDAAYVIYTSGSSGTPKGVVVEHKSLVNLCFWHNGHYGITEKDRSTKFAGFGFDASVWEIFPYLVAGAALHIITDETRLDVVRLNEYFEKHGITASFLPTQVCEQFMEMENKSLRVLMTGGDKLKHYTKRGYRLVNNYGPTENTVVTTCFEVGRYYNNIPVGRPVSNTRVYITDKNNNVQPIGIAGELCISGDSLARGYLNRPGLTEEKFVPDPFTPGERMYRTGDLARWLPDGNIEFLGRMDNQVKIRGYRIEPGEIESRLLKYGPVSEAVVLAKEDTGGGRYLCAYTVSGESLIEEELRAHLSRELPEYMIPACFIQLPKMPLTANGKIDVKALPEPGGDFGAGREYVAPGNKNEEILAKVWQEVLKSGKVGIEDNFFSLGGDSIKAIQVLSRLNHHNLTLDIRDLFKNPTIAELSGCVRETARKISQGTVEGRTGLTPIQNWLFESYGNKNHFNQAVMLYRSQGFEEGAVRHVISRLTEHHDALRMVIRKDGEEFVQLNRGMEGELYYLETRDLRGADGFGDEIERASTLIQKKMDIERGPLVRAGLFKTDAGDHLLIAVHHLAIDGISWRILLEDFAAGYINAVNQEDIKFPGKTDSFVSWTKKLHEFGASEELLGEAEYWRAVEKTPVNPLPKDKNQAVRKYKDSKSVIMELAEEDTEKLLKHANDAYHTEINDLLLTALGLAVKEWTGDAKILVNLEGHGREEIIKDIDIKRTVGWFTSMYPVILDMEGEKDIAYRIKSIKENLRHIPGKGVGYGILKYLTPPEKREGLDFKLKPEISFNYMGQFDSDIQGEIITRSDIAVGESVDPEMDNPYCIDIAGMVEKGKLLLAFSYSRNEYEKDTVEKVALYFRKSLEGIIRHCTAKESAELTPSDFTIKNLSLEGFENILGGMDRANIKDIYTLAPTQEGVLYHTLLDSESHAYFEQLSLSIEGSLDADVIEESFNRLIERHDALRTVFAYEKTEKPMQIVLKKKKITVIREDISNLPEGEKTAFLEEYSIRDRENSFDLARDIPLRISIINTGIDAYELIWSYHHIIMDGWCMGVVFRELFMIYEALRSSRQPELGGVYPYSDYMVWLGNQDFGKASSYWKSYLSGYSEKAYIPGAKSIQLNGGYALEETNLTIGGEVVKKLEELSLKNNTTLSTLLQALWGVLLQKYNNSEDVVFGTVVSGRPPEVTGIESMVGLFINTVPVRVQAKGEESFGELLAQAQEASVEAVRYSYCPLAEIQSATEVKDGLIDHIMVFENYPVEEEVGNWSSDRKLGFHVSKAGNFEQTSYDFNIIVLPGKELNIKFSYNALIYDRDSIEKIKGHLKLAAECVANNPGIKVRNVELLAQDEKAMLLEGFNDTAADYPRDRTITDLFESQVERTPDNISAVFDGKSLTYRQLNERVNRLSRALVKKGVERDSVAALMLGRSMEMIVGALGILKAGGAYLPIDPDYPEDRINYMLRDSGTKILITSEEAKRNTEFDGITLYISDSELYSEDSGNPGNVNSPEDLAYIIYTSGTTGKPKGVMIEHRNVVRLMRNDRMQFDFSENDVWTLFHSFCFDFSVWEMYGALLYGGKLVIVPKLTAQDTGEYLKLLKREKVTVLNQTPSAFYSLIGYELLHKEKELSVRYVIFGGEALKPGMLRGWKEKYPETLLINMYGITETTVHVTLKKISDDEINANISNIGRPIPTLTAYVMDRHMKLMPAGIAGELYVGGEGVARGYLNNSELTEQKFMQNPYKPLESLYRSGDLVRMLPNGEMEYLGRADHQVKIRGFRVELGEIEVRLLAHPSVKEALVMAMDDEGGTKYLCAYITAEKETTVEVLREYLLKEVPEYMIPSYFIRLDRIPLTSNGKADRKALPKPEGSIHAGTEYVAPSNEIEEKLALLWKKILGIEKIGVRDNFFEIGGHSLKATNLISGIHKEFDVEVPLREIFKAPTIAEIAQFIRQSGKSEFYSIQPAEEREYYPMSSTQKRVYVLNQFEGVGVSYNIPNAVLLEGKLDKARLENAFRELIKRHESLRTTFEMADGEPVQKIHKDMAFDVEYIETTEEAAAKTVGRLIKPFDLGRLPLIRVYLLKVGEEKHIMLYDIHHIIFDGTSMGIIAGEFMRLYGGETLEPLRIQYKDYSVWYKGLYDNGTIKKQEDYWLKRLSDELPVLDMPLDYPRPAVQSFEGDSAAYILEKDLTEALNALAEKKGATLYMVLLAAYNTLLYRYTGQNDIVVGSGIAARNHEDLKNIIGMFVNTLVMRNFPESEKTFEQFLEEVRKNALEAYENQEYQFEELVEKLNVKKDLSRNAVFDTALILQNMDTSYLEIDGVKAVPYNTEFRISKFDITLYAIEVGDKIKLDFEYCTRLFKKETIQRLGAHFINILRETAKDLRVKLKDISVMSSDEEREILIDFNPPASEYEGGKTISRLFEECAGAVPDRTAVVFGNEKLTYKELDKRANRLANCLADRHSVRPGSFVGILMEKSHLLPVAILGVIKAGGAYIPIDPEYPKERIKSIINDAGINVVVSTTGQLKTLNRLQWECETFNAYMCIDGNDIYMPESIEDHGLMDKSLWEYIGRNATNEIAGGGWINSYTGEEFTKKEMDEYSQNILGKLRPYLKKETRVLEIGCASGISMFRIAPNVAAYHGTDLSGVIIEKNKQRVLEEEIGNITLECLPAHDIDKVSGNEFDVVIINSVIQSFPGYNYLRDVLGKSISLLKDKGILFLGDIMDHGLKTALIQSAVEFKRDNPKYGKKTKTDFSNELFVSKSFFNDLKAEFQEIKDIYYSNKIGTIENELTRFRYDTVVEIDKKRHKAAVSKNKYQYGMDALSQYNDNLTNIHLNPSDLAYVIYTSGSTGKPKGVMVEHRGIANLKRFFEESFDINRDDKIIQFASSSFDASVWEIFMALLSGAALYMVPEEIIGNYTLFSQYINSNGITVATLPPAYLANIEPESIETLRLLITAGSAAGYDLVNRWRKKVQYVNAYGPTETTVCSTVWKDCGEHVPYASIPIGKPINNFKVYIVDRGGKLQPVGVAGELCVSGDGLARGYLNREEITEEKFIINPFTGSERMYKTGDLAKWLPDGNIEFLGRIDHQVKIRGYRIELEEIELQMGRYEAITESKVAAREGNDGDSYLCAYYVASRELAAADLREYLSQELPEYMIPTYFVSLPAMPVTINGKIDLKALPAPEDLINTSAEYVAPVDEVEQKLVDLWKEILGASRVGTSDNFFELGGHSLKATSLVSKIFKTFNVKIPINEVFAQPTIKAIAQYIRIKDEEQLKIEEILSWVEEL